MTYAELILPEFDHEMASTRKVLESLPEDKFDWKAHPKSHTIGWNANHLAEIPGWVAGTISSKEWDIAPIGEEPYRTPEFQTKADVLALFDKNVAEARQALSTASFEHMGETWSLLMGGVPVITMPRAGIIRSFVINHTIHHRAISTVYLRLNDTPVPGMYGPTGDEK
ncbi:DinB family protein [Planctomicrobium piriforme]|uniref:Uncharacterized damage-inducible protein DinB (Forms a four-helix bundle) n=1 Tax=Planctomicrobium piriforme TaxID=1576369 RepID=A0A1I3BML4_9PLAN|nr:DinB family protein [Planctomicrobium piriforme]SFH63518.1 Uncharacterized damage-inducible protein DinB (forms a four-helix bundle) [Planctomicrobium piriforme]